MGEPTSRSEETIFIAALDLNESMRADFLDRACAGDDRLRAAVEALLQAHARAGDFLRGSAETAVNLNRAEDRPGERIGRYKLLQRIGEGGCGIVYMAEQEEPVRRRVALKVIKLGMDTKAVIARFEAERQALALMDHPNIAKVLDAGATESGRPFFVMELVRGIPLTKYCDEKGLSTSRRLELFTHVCHAIQHAHQKGIIHRDIKPSNILVTSHDGTPLPKVIDFGIAKAAQGRLTDHTLFTAFEQFIGTPAYMSPEQAEMSALDIDTRSDIYSLGVLLYELLTGRPPFDPKTFLSAGLDEMRRMIREVDPPKPSTRLSTLAATDRATVAELRGTAPAQLSGVLAGDLDWIVMRCLEKDRARRYDTAAALAADVRRHLANEPVAARPPSSSYRLRKFCRRHRAGVFAAAAVALALVIGLVVSAGMFIRERAARQRAGAAELAEARLRREAEAARGEEVKRAARTALDLANRHLADGQVADGLAYLVYAARKDPLNRTLAPRIASVLASHNFLLPQAAPLACGSRVLAMRFARDGRSFFVGTEDGAFRVMDAATGAVKRLFQTGGTVAPDGWEFARLNESVVGVRFTDNTFALYDVATGTLKFPRLELDPQAGLPESNRIVGLSPKGTWVYAVASGQFWLWHADTGRLLFHLNFPDVMQGCDFSPSEDTLAIIVGHRVARWALPDGKPIDPAFPFQAVSAKPYGTELRFSPDGRDLAIVGSDSVQIMDATTGILLHQLPGGHDLVPAATGFVSGDRLFVRSQSQSNWWDLTDNKISPTPSPHMLGVSLDAAGRRGVALSSDGLLRVFDTASNAPTIEAAWRQTDGYCAAISPDGNQVLLGTGDGQLYRFGIGQGSARPLVVPKIPGPLLPSVFLPGLPVRLFVPTETHAKVIGVVSGHETGRDIVFPKPALGNPTHDTHSPIRSDARFMVIRTTQSGWQSWELGPEGIRRVSPLQEAGNEPAIVTFSPAGDRVVVANQSSPRVWDLRSGEAMGPALAFPGLANPFSLSFNSDGSRLAMGARDGSTIVFDVKTSRPLFSLPTRRQIRILAAQFSPDGERILTTNQQGESQLWNSITAEPIGPVVQVMSSMDLYHQPVFSPDGRWVAVPFQKTIVLLDGRNGTEAGHRISAGGDVVSFTSDGNRLGTAEPSGTVQVWDVPSGEAITEPMQHPGEASLPEFSPDGRFLKTDGARVSLWAVPSALPEGTSPPEWLLELATLCASQIVNDAGQLVPAKEMVKRVESLRQQIAALPADAPLADWGRWVLDDRPGRSIAPGFTIAPAEADQVAARTQ